MESEIIILGLGAIAAVAILLAASPSAIPDTAKSLETTLTEVPGDILGNLWRKVTGRTEETQQAYEDRQGQFLLGQTCLVNSDCSQSGTEISSVGGDAFSSIGCVRNVCDRRNRGFLPTNPRPGSKIDTDTTSNRITNNTYVGEYRTVGLGQSCVNSRECSGTGIPGQAFSLRDVKCCGGVCAATRKDWANANVCPEVCKAGAFQRAGTCTNKGNLELAFEQSQLLPITQIPMTQDTTPSTLGTGPFDMTMLI